MSSSTSGSGGPAESEDELVRRLQGARKRVRELEKKLEAERQRKKEEVNKKKRKLDELIGGSATNDADLLYKNISRVSSGVTDRSKRLWQERLRMYEEIRMALVTIGGVPRSSFPFDRIGLEELEGMSEIWTCVARDQAAIEQWEQPLLASIRDKVIALKKRVEDHEKQSETGIKSGGRGG
ncbi:hypothetical protein SLS58_009829 [Diplodia intermedia]|uniref:Uncharacterized protein n=1 Tax=Diplodia intermedia TaxID=856260 RepID=A0ABR3TA41_9PEZI